VGLGYFKLFSVPPSFDFGLEKGGALTPRELAEAFLICLLGSILSFFPNTVARVVSHNPNKDMGDAFRVLRKQGLLTHALSMQIAEHFVSKVSAGVCAKQMEDMGFSKASATLVSLMIAGCGETFWQTHIEQFLHRVSNEKMSSAEAMKVFWKIPNKNIVPYIFMRNVLLFSGLMGVPEFFQFVYQAAYHEGPPSDSPPNPELWAVLLGAASMGAAASILDTIKQAIQSSDQYALTAVKKLLSQVLYSISKSEHQLEEISKKRSSEATSPSNRLSDSRKRFRSSADSKGRALPVSIPDLAHVPSAPPEASKPPKPLRVRRSLRKPIRLIEIRMKALKLLQTKLERGIYSRLPINNLTGLDQIYSRLALTQTHPVVLQRLSNLELGLTLQKTNHQVAGPLAFYRAAYTAAAKSLFSIGFVPRVVAACAWGFSGWAVHRMGHLEAYSGDAHKPSGSHQLFSNENAFRHEKASRGSDSIPYLTPGQAAIIQRRFGGGNPGSNPQKSSPHDHPAVPSVDRLRAAYAARGAIGWF
jgi:hypothetical protein